jgi:putative transposase
MAQHAVARHAISICLTCRAFSISETCTIIRLNSVMIMYSLQNTSLKKIQIRAGVDVFLIYSTLKIPFGIIDVFTSFTVKCYKTFVLRLGEAETYAPEQLK